VWVRRAGLSTCQDVCGDDNQIGKGHPNLQWYIGARREPAQRPKTNEHSEL
jgi:hypothetical protein